MDASDEDPLNHLLRRWQYSFNAAHTQKPPVIPVQSAFPFRRKAVWKPQASQAFA